MEGTIAGGMNSLKLRCFSFLENDQIPSRYTCDGININPALYLDDIPKATKSLAILVEDPDVPHDSFCHWVAWNIPVTNHIKEKENRGVFGINDFGQHDYNGPHPFSTTHRYFFRVYALNCLLNLPVNSTKTELKWAMKNHVLATGVIAGRYKKQNSLENHPGPAKPRQLISGELNMLLSEKGTTCVSVIIPLHHLPAEQRADKLYLAKAIREACETVSSHFPSEAASVNENLKRLLEEVSFGRNDEGIGLYASSDINFYSTFPFAVTERIAAGKSFQLKEMFIKEQYSVPYHVLYVDEKEIRLYSGKLNRVNEVKEGGFPMFFEEEYECSLPVGGFDSIQYPVMKRFERQQYEVEQVRHMHFVDQADELLQSRLPHSEMLVLCGPRRYVSEFASRSSCASRAIGSFYGHYGRFTETDFAAMLWPSVKAHLDEKAMEELKEVKEKEMLGLTEEGIISVWEAVAAGRGETLFIEKGLSMKGFLDDADSWHLYLHPPRHSHIELHDAVNELITAMLNNDGRIIFVKDGTLVQHQHVTLTTKF